MGVYINMEMPKEGFVEILIRDDGTVQQTGKSYRIDGTDYYTPYVGEMPTIYKAVPVPPHGDLIDRDALLDTATIHWSQTTNESCFPIDEIEYALTIIPASKEGE